MRGKKAWAAICRHSSAKGPFALGKVVSLTIEIKKRQNNAPFRMLTKSHLFEYKGLTSSFEPTRRLFNVRHRNFEQRADDEDDILVGTHLSKLPQHTTPFDPGHRI
ncbi:hypothetical protein AVEN_203628-1 [Araneus ventricosus]|uniref:Uncharacterized protein n=1 Tax=Araneus ventricosus TaxID=182803 RepID=A0A4Y2BBE0_ARAVE|nr:hypothetical protein AVEN_203628-1 [Araneus ventricosus]